MKIGEIDIPEQQTVHSVVTNAVYWVASVLIAAAGGWTQEPAAMLMSALVAYALCQQCTGSIAFHFTADDQIWAQLLDAVSIQWVMAALVALSVHSAFDVTPWVLVPCVLGAWAFWWYAGDEVRRNPAVAVQVLVVVGLMGLSVGWGWALTCFFLIVLAVGVQLRTSTHSVWHSLWHILAGAGQALSGSLLALHAGGITIPFPL